jgi:phytanoyl-CoA hydroxylase
MKNTPWLDEADALSQVDRRTNDSVLQEVGRRIVRDGFAIIPQLIPTDLCDRTVADHASYVTGLGDDTSKYRDSNGRLLRLVNFHLTSKAAADIATHPALMKALDFLFGEEAAVYSSLYFEYGTQQPIHRDSPFFETFPRNYFVGAWVALEDISPDAGPLMYHSGGHRFKCDPHAIYDQVRERMPLGTSSETLVLEALEVYYGKIIDTAAAMGSPTIATLKKGDVAIWHAQLPHGGSPAKDLSLTRRSMVFHCSPKSKQVYQHDVFFSHRGSEPEPRYGFTNHGNRSIALSGSTAFQT